MKKTIIVLLFFIMTNCMALYCQDNANSEKPTITKYNIKIAYIYEKKSLLIANSDFYGSYTIEDKVNDKIKVKAGLKSSDGKELFSTGDIFYINQGSKSGIKEGTVYTVKKKGNKISKYGYYIQDKAIAKVTKVYPEIAGLKIIKSYRPVRVGDFLEPTKKFEQLRKYIPDYERSNILETEIKGKVIHQNLDTNAQRDLAGDQNYVAVSMNKSMLKQGDYILFYRNIGEGLPPIISGIGIVIHPCNKCSIVKIHRCNSPIEKGNTAVLIKDMIEEKTENNEIVPLLGGKGKGKTTNDIRVQFIIDKYKADDKEMERVLSKIKELIKDKKEYAIMLRGYSCSIGSEKYNLKLSKQRADFVKDFLMKKLKLKNNDIETKFFGEKENNYSNDNEAARRKNRSVIIQVIAK